MGPPLLYDVQMYAVRCRFGRVCKRCWADGTCAAGVLVLAGVLNASVLLDDARGRPPAYSGRWEAPQEGV